MASIGAAIPNGATSSGVDHASDQTLQLPAFRPRP